MAALVCGRVPFVRAFIFEVLLGLFLRDQGATDGVLEFSRALVGILDDVNYFAAESVFVDELLDLQR